MKAKNQRLTLLLLAVAAVVVALILGMWGVRERASFFYSPSVLAEKGIPLDRPVRVGGMVVRGSVRTMPDGVTHEFKLEDGTSAPPIPVRYANIRTPDLFRECSGAIADGRFQPNGVFIATEILAKHDENYMPPDLASMRSTGCQQ